MMIVFDFSVVTSPTPIVLERKFQPVQWTRHLTHGYTVSTKLETCMIHLHNYNDNANLLIH